MEFIIFTELFEPFVTAARTNLAQRAGKLLELLLPAARNGLERFLIKRLSDTALPTLSRRYEVYCKIQQPFLPAPAPSQEGNAYRRFMQKMLAGEWSRLLREYPVLARLLTTITDFWVESSLQFLQRVNDDLKVIQERFCPEERLSRMSDIQSGLSDPHQKGQAVMQVTFDNGLTLMYKPRNLDLDTAWFKFLQRLNLAGISMPFRCVQVLSRNDYGWMEYVEACPCRSQEQVRHYYQRAGMLLCLLYLFDGSDFHHENVIPCEDQPVLIDLETLMTPRMQEQEQRLHPRRITETVLRTHFLPHWELGSDKRFYDVGGMTRERRCATLHDSLQALQTVVEQGFREMYRFLTEHQELVEDVLSEVDGQRIRTIFQDTGKYTRLIRNSLHPKFLKNEPERSIELERLIRLSFPTDLLNKHIPRIKAEIQSIEQLDIPCFETRSDSTHLQVSATETIPDYFSEPCALTIRRNLRQLHSEDLECQIRLIQNTFAFKAAVDGENEITPRPLTRIGSFENACKTGKSGVQNLDFAVGKVDQNTAKSKISQQNQDLALLRNLPLKTEFLQAAIDIADQICTIAVRLESGAVTWMIPEEMTVGDDLAYRFRQSDSFLYQGNAGIALFLAAMASIRPYAGYAEMARAALAPLFFWLKDPQFPSGIRIGAANGLGSLVYALTRIAGWLDSSEILEKAVRATELITPDRIWAGTHLDLFDGAAGTILGLLALYRATRERNILNRASLCGDVLLAQRVETQSGQRAWNTIQASPVTGLSHGAAGIAYALLRLFQAIGQEMFLNAAEEGIAFERTLFSPEKGNWRAFDSSAENPDFWTTYCHGAPGIGLARLGGLSVLDKPEIQVEIDLALRTTAEFPLGGPDFLCCGNFGRIEMLLTAGLRLKRWKLVEMARKKAAHVLSRKKEYGGFDLFDDLPARVINPGFFRGTAGIGYELLRLTYLEQFPCVLLWE